MKAMKMSPYLASMFLFATSSPPADTLRQSLAAHSDRMFFWLVVSSAVTGIGVIFEAPAELHELGRWWKIRRLGKPIGWKVPITFFGLVLVIGGIIGEGIFEFLSANAETEIRAHDEQVLGDTIIEAGDARDSAEAAKGAAVVAGKAAGQAKDASSGAVKSSGNALTLATSARKEADTFETDIKSANTNAASAESHLAEALKRAADAEKETDTFEADIAAAKKQAADAESHLADALQRAANSEAELERLKTPRSISRLDQFISDLKRFKGTKYAFQSVVQDEESINLLKSINEMLKQAGWERDKSIDGFPALLVYGKEQADFSVPIGFGTGVQLFANAPDVPADWSTVQISDLPVHLKAAIALNNGLGNTVIPAGKGNTGGQIMVDKGDLLVIRIAVGKKPVE
jgi:hypothetical protein